MIPTRLGARPAVECWSVSQPSKTKDPIMTTDVKRLQTVLADLAGVLDQLEFEFVDDPNWPEPSDTSYLDDSDRADPDIHDPR